MSDTFSILDSEVATMVLLLGGIADTVLDDYTELDSKSKAVLYKCRSAVTIDKNIASMKFPYVRIVSS